MDNAKRVSISQIETKQPPGLLVVIAFAIVYLVWGSTYFFIRIAITHIPALLMASMRFLTSGLLLFGWCAARGDKMFVAENVKPALVSGLLLLFLGNGAVVWGEKYLPSSLVAVFTSSSPIWFVVLDKRNWTINFHSRATVIGLIIGFVGVLLLFSEKAARSFSSTGNPMEVVAMGILLVGSLSWAAGSLFSKYHSKGNSQSANTAWQMLAAGVVFALVSAFSGEWKNFSLPSVTSGSWWALIYLITLGSLAGYSAFTWLLRVRPATQVSTHAYVNPVVAVLLGISFAGEKMSFLQWIGLAVVLCSVLLINLARSRKERQLLGEQKKNQSR
jgi:drug/metabolite transporter (DMT)-like permease